MGGKSEKIVQLYFEKEKCSSTAASIILVIENKTRRAVPTAGSIIRGAVRTAALLIVVIKIEIRY